MKIALAFDHAGFLVKDEIIAYLKEKGCETEDFGTFSSDSCDYPDYAYPAALAVAKGECDFGVFICGTGIGISLVANKVKGVRAAPCSDAFTAEMTRRHNDSNVLALGQRIISVEKMKELIDIFLSSPFEGGKHERRVEKINLIESGKTPFDYKE